MKTVYAVVILAVVVGIVFVRSRYAMLDAERAVTETNIKLIILDKRVKELAGGAYIAFYVCVPMAWCKTAAPMPSFREMPKGTHT
jgi:hypothetical protein